MEGTNPNTAQKLRKTKNAKRAYAILASLVFLALVVVVFKVVLSNNSSSTPKVAVVRITDNGFQPATLTVKKGTKIVWDSSSENLHQITANPFPKGTDLPGLKSQILNNAQQYTYVADTTGSFGYHDQLHPTVNGTLVVKK